MFFPGMVAPWLGVLGSELVELVGRESAAHPAGQQHPDAARG